MKRRVKYERRKKMLIKSEVIAVIDEVMNNREIDSIRDAILAIRDKVIELREPIVVELPRGGFAKLRLRGNDELCVTSPHFDGAKYVCIDTLEKVDTGAYGTIWYE